MELIRKLLKRQILQLSADIPRKIPPVLRRRCIPPINLVLRQGEVACRRLYGLHEETENEKSCCAGRPFPAVLLFEDLGEGVEEVLHFAHDELVGEGFYLASENAGCDPGSVLVGDEAGELEGEDGFVGEAQVAGHDVVHGVDGEGALDQGGL